MRLTTTEDLEERIGSKYLLVLLVAKRARMLREGAPKLVQTNSTNPISIALQEITEGRLGVQVREAPLTEAEARLAEEAERLTPAIPINVDVSEIEGALEGTEEEEHEEAPYEDLMVPTGEEEESEEEEEEHTLIEPEEDEEPIEDLDSEDIVEE